MDPATIALVIGIGSVLKSLFGFIGRMEDNKRIDEANAKNLDLQREAWNREDTAVQRRKADLEAAGLSPTLAAGSAAAASSPSFKFQNTLSGLEHIGAAMNAPTQALQGYANAKQQKAGIDTAEANATIAKNDAEISDQRLTLNKQNVVEEAAILKNESIKSSLEARIAREEYQNILDENARRPEKNEIQDLMIEQMKQDIKNGDWNRALKISDSLTNTIMKGYTMGHMAQRNALYQQQIIQQAGRR